VHILTCSQPLHDANNTAKNTPSSLPEEREYCRKKTLSRKRGKGEQNEVRRKILTTTKKYTYYTHRETHYTRE